MSKSLFDLIKTLSRAEKRVFSENLRQTKRMSYYAKLVAVYSKSEVYSLKIDVRIFRSESPKFISDCKTKCKQLLCDFLVTLEKNKGIRKQVEQKYKVALMLKNRRQFNEAKKLLEKIDSIATKYELLELLIQIKAQKISLALLLGSDNRKLDFENLKALIQDKEGTIQHLSNYNNVKDEAVLAAVNYHVNIGAIECESQEEANNEDQFKSLGLTIGKHQEQFFKYLDNKNYKNALIESGKILLLAEQHKNIVLESELLIVGYTNYIFLYVELSCICNRKIDINHVLKKFDNIPCNSVKVRWEILRNKIVTGCIYALSINNPSIAVPWIEKAEQYLKQYYYLREDNTANVLYPICTYFAIGAWEKCLLYIDRIEANITDQNTGSTLFNFRLICIYEQNDLYYFNSLVNKLMARKRKRGAKAGDFKNMNDTVFYILFCMSQKTSALEVHFNRLLNVFDPGYRFYRYFIHWIACQFPDLLNGADYKAFLKKHEYQHYDFTALKTNKM